MSPLDSHSSTSGVGLENPSAETRNSVPGLEEFFVRRTLENYFNAIDARDATRMLECFADEAQARYQVGQVGERFATGKADIVGDIMKSQARFEHATHAISSIAIRMQGESATAITFGVVHLVRDGKVLVRGLRYDDELAKVGTEWKIASRVHRPSWQYEAVALNPNL